MFRWTITMLGSKDIVLLDPEKIESNKLAAIFKEIQDNLGRQLSRNIAKDDKRANEVL